MPLEGHTLSWDRLAVDNAWEGLCGIAGLCHHRPFSGKALVQLEDSQLSAWLRERGGGLAEGLGLQETSPRVSSFLPFLLEMQMASREESFQRMKAVFKKTLISSLTSF